MTGMKLVVLAHTSDIDFTDIAALATPVQSIANVMYSIVSSSILVVIFIAVLYAMSYFPQGVCKTSLSLAGVAGTGLA